jgi:hypothetical protein
MGNSVILLSAKNHTHRRVLSLVNSMLFRVVEIEVHLPHVGVSEAPQLQIFCGVRRYVALSGNRGFRSGDHLAERHIS